MAGCPAMEASVIYLVLRDEREDTTERIQGNRINA
jgi:hypothetical protein